MRSSSRLLALAVALAALTFDSARADGTSEAIESVIRRQIAAFHRDDGPAAFAFASPMIQGKFGTPERFRLMVEQAYPQIYRAEQLTFLELVPHQGRLLQKVLVRDANGGIVTAVYAMTSVDGAWRIDGCWFIRPSSSV